MKLSDIINKHIKYLNRSLELKEVYLGEQYYQNNAAQILSQTGYTFDLIVETDFESQEFKIVINDDVEAVDQDKILVFSNKKNVDWNRYSYACLLQIENELHILEPSEVIEHKKYTRKGMINRVLKERRIKSEKADYRIEWADNIYGDHIVINDKGQKYKIFLRNFENETGYSDSLDSKFNKLGTSKHLMYAFKKLKENKKLFNKLDKTYPFIEIYCDPLNEYKISWNYPDDFRPKDAKLIKKYFGNKKYIEDDKLIPFLDFIDKASKIKSFHIRPEVYERVERAYEDNLLKKLSTEYKPDYNKIKTTLYDYQKQGIEFTLFKKAAIIADDMGLGKTVQAIASAILKKEIFSFQKTLIVCPASIKEQWKEEIEKFSDEKAVVVQGFPYERQNTYFQDKYYFFIVNYETVLRDLTTINRAGIDFIIMDEAQRVKNYETKTANALKSIKSKHKLAITGTPIENKLIDIYSLMQILDPYFLGPLWEFSYKHCLFDPERHNKINGYYNLKNLNKKLIKILLRREKRKVLNQLPNISQNNIFVNMSPLQAEMHQSFAKGLASILRKKFLTPYDMQKMQILLANMRMVCDSTHLIDDHTNDSPKLVELKHILLEKLDIKNTDQKIIIFSEWIKVHKLIGKLLRDNDIGFVELSGKIPVKLRGDLIRKFEKHKEYKVFLSTEAGGSGLNLQVADTLFNFELPWNPAKKNQRIGRIDRLGQKSNKLIIYNFITRNSIEEKIASGLIVKQNLFEGVLNTDAPLDFVDFSQKGRSQFIEQLEEILDEFDKNIEITEIMPDKEVIYPEEKLVEEPEELIEEQKPTHITDESSTTQDSKAAELEKVMNSGLQFLAGMFKMSTGKDLGLEDQSIEINKDTGEVIMKFKIPKI